jgi:hypothetical protein
MLRYPATRRVLVYSHEKADSVTCFSLTRGDVNRRKLNRGTPAVDIAAESHRLLSHLAQIKRLQERVYLKERLLGDPQKAI